MEPDWEKKIGRKKDNCQDITLSSTAECRVPLPIMEYDYQKVFFVGRKKRQLSRYYTVTYGRMPCASFNNGT